MADLTNLFSDIEQQRQAFDRLRRFDGGDGGGYDETMNIRLTALETRLDTMLPTLATKSDIGDTKIAIESVKAEIHKASGETHKWMIATVIGLFLGFGGLFLAMSNALKPSTQTPSAQPAPIVIQIPAQTPATPSRPAK